MPPNLLLPLVSVIVPVRNEEHLIAQCLRSLLDQDYPKDRLEVLVVDNDSTDRSRKIIRQFPVQYLFEKKKGASAARNAGARAARGDLLAFTDSDCVVPSHWVSRLVSALNEDSVDAAGGDTPVNSQGSLIGDYLISRGHYSQKEFFSDASSSSPWLITGNMIVRRSTFQSIGGFEETLLPGEDMDLSWRIVLSGGRLKYLPDLKTLGQRVYSLADFYASNFCSGRVAFLLSQRYKFFFLKENGGFFYSLGKTFLSKFFKLEDRFRHLFRKNGLSFLKKVFYLFLMCSGHLIFLSGKWASQVHHERLRKPLPVPILLPFTFVGCEDKIFA